jgi:hypothetical protein
MKALTISQPYASLIARGEKWVENRKWETKYRGTLAIHAGKGTQYLDAREMREQGYPSGCILAVCDLVACFRLRDIDKVAGKLAAVGFTLPKVLDHEHTEGPWCWLLSNVRELCEPVPCRGAQGLWDWTVPDYLMDAIETV